HRYLHSFPTRRSSDLDARIGAPEGGPEIPELLIHQRLDGRGVHDAAAPSQRVVGQVIRDERLARARRRADQRRHLLLERDDGLDLELVQRVAPERKRRHDPPGLPLPWARPLRRHPVQLLPSAAWRSASLLACRTGVFRQIRGASWPCRVFYPALRRETQ